MIFAEKKQKLSDNHRRTVCRLAFLVVVVFPTALVLRLVFAESPGQRLMTAVRSATGLRTTIGQVETPRPGQYTLHDVSIDNGTLGNVRLGTVHVATGEICRIHVENKLHMDPRELVQLARQFCDIAMPSSRQQLANCRPIEVTCDSLIFADSRNPDDPERQLILTPVGMTFGVADDRSLTQLWFRFAGQVSSTPTTVTIERRLSDAKNDWIRIDTGDSQNLPVWLAACLWPDAERLGKRSQFAGQAELRFGPDGIQDGFLRGNFAQVDLAALSAGTALELKGVGQFAGMNCLVANGRIRRLDASFAGRLNGIAPEMVHTLQRRGWWVKGFTEESTEMQFDCSLADGKIDIFPGSKNGKIVAMVGREEFVRADLMQSSQSLEQVAIELYPGNEHVLNDRAVEFLHHFNLGPDVSGTDGANTRVADRADSPSNNF